MEMFSTQNITTRKVKKLMQEMAASDEKISRVYVRKLAIDEKYRSAINPALERLVGFVGVAKSQSSNLRRTYLWIPLSSKVMVFEGEPFKKRYAPLLFPEVGSFLFHTNGKQTYWRNFKYTRWSMKAVEDIEEIDLVDVETDIPDVSRGNYIMRFRAMYFVDRGLF